MQRRVGQKKNESTAYLLDYRTREVPADAVSAPPGRPYPDSDYSEGHHRRNPNQNHC
jgi:hypothetical protein